MGILALDETTASPSGRRSPSSPRATSRRWASTSSPRRRSAAGWTRTGSTSARHVIPAMLEAGARVFGYRYNGYWQDVGTVQSYWETNMALLEDDPELDLYDKDWVIHTRSEERAPAKIGPTAQVHRSLISHGCVINGTVERRCCRRACGSTSARSCATRSSCSTRSSGRAPSWTGRSSTRRSSSGRTPSSARVRTTTRPTSRSRRASTPASRSSASGRSSRAARASAATSRSPRTSGSADLDQEGHQERRVGRGAGSQPCGMTRRAARSPRTGGGLDRGWPSRAPPGALRWWIRDAPARGAPSRSRSLIVSVRPDDARWLHGEAAKRRHGSQRRSARRRDPRRPDTTEPPRRSRQIRCACRRPRWSSPSASSSCDAPARPTLKPSRQFHYDPSIAARAGMFSHPSLYRRGDFATRPGRHSGLQGDTYGRSRVMTSWDAQRDTHRSKPDRSKIDQPGRRKTSPAGIRRSIACGHPRREDGGERGHGQAAGGYGKTRWASPGLHGRSGVPMPVHCVAPRRPVGLLDWSGARAEVDRVHGRPPTGSPSVRRHPGADPRRGWVPACELDLGCICRPTSGGGHPGWQAHGTS